MTPRLRDLAVAVISLGLFGALLVALFDTPWNRLLLGFILVMGWIAIAVTAWRAGVPYVPADLTGVPEQPRRTTQLKRWVAPTWIALTATWVGAGWLVTNGGG